jgi:hypothetical protein
MSRVENADQLLEDINRVMGEGLADHAPEDVKTFFEHFLPIPRHLRALDPQVRLIIGDKGAGKTQLFKALTFPEGRKLLAKVAADHGHLTLPLERLNWRIGFEAQGTAFPPSGTFDAIKGREVGDLREIWLALLTRVLEDTSEEFSADLRTYKNSVSPAFNEWDLNAVIHRTKEKEGLILATIDQLDKQLAAKDHYIAVVYDDLDRVSPGDWETVRSTLQGLVQLWAVYSRRWQRIRCKIFLRRDLYERAALRGPDIAKIAWNPADLFWNAGELYQLLFKRLANASTELKTYLEKGRLGFKKEVLLGWVPEATEEGEFAPIVKHVFSEHMGGDPSRGATLRWIPNHLKDGHGRIFPRPLLRLIQDATRIEKRDRQASRPHLIHHTAIRGALDQVSEFRVEELVREEFPWLKRVQSAFKEHPFRVPVERRVVLKHLNIDWSNQKDLPPETEPDRLLDYLVELGISSVRSNKLVDVGDLYLKGLHLKRRGGVARPKKLGPPMG